MVDPTSLQNNDISQVILLASGKKNLCDSSRMKQLNNELNNLGFKIICFNLMEPFTEENLKRQWRSQISIFDHKHKLIIGGRSQGGRVATLIADEFKVKACFCIGYPFYTPLITDSSRISPLQKLKTPMIILQGEFDKYGEKSKISSYQFSSSIKIYWKDGADHHLDGHSHWIAQKINELV